MLNKSERYQVMEILRIYSIVGLLPIEVDLANCQLKTPSIGKKVICFLSGSLFTLHAFYKIGSLAYVYCFLPHVPLPQLIIHALAAMGSAMCIHWYYTLYISSPPGWAAYVNITLLGNAGGILDERDGVKSHWKGRLMEYSLQDLIAGSLPAMTMVAVVATIATYIYEPTMKLLLYAALPTGLQNWATFGLCLIEEAWFLLIYVAVFVPVWQLQVISYDLVSKQLKLTMQTLQSGSQSVLGVYFRLRRLQLYVSLVNDVNSYMIFTWKLVSIATCIIGGYAAIAHFSNYPIFGILYYVLTFDVILTYTIIYDKAFKIPELFGRVTACSLLRLRGTTSNVLRRRIRSIPLTGIKVGNFHKMERQSTLIFIDFVVKNIVNMLVAYG